MNKTIINELITNDYSTRESYKSLRTNFLFCGEDNKTILITSSVKGEGKSTVSVELAKSLAIADKKVLLIDADLRKSVYSTIYTTPSQDIVGLSEYLSGQTSFENILYYTQYDNLSLIYAGAIPPNPVELLGSAKFEALIKDSREKYDFVIIDAAPLGAVIDAAAIAAFCDGAIMVIAANEIRTRLAQDVKEQIEKSKCKVLGVVLNKIPMKVGSYYDNYYRKYYGRGKNSKRGFGHYGDYGYGEDTLKKKK